MVLRFFRGGGDDTLERVEATLQRMLHDDRHSFDAAASALIGGADPDVVGPDLRATDRRVNAAEREIRRELVVHASVQTGPDVPAILVYMSIVKDVERIGDYAKNIYDLAAEGADFSSAPDRDELVAVRDRVSHLIAESARVFAERDTEAARDLIAEGDRLLDTFDEAIGELVRSDRPSSYGVPRALFWRYCKRVVAHLMNVLSAVVMPLDQLDYFDEDRTTRG
ncbi:MAG: PhoU domain-containing protein [Actinobacteria bacterium]|nr:PhoU domain-containing protein [Actinomycetota bacterium]